jgi:hypothetical protein
MSIDDRLRASLQWDPTIAPATQRDPLDVIVARATRRRRVRVAAVVAAAAAAALVAVAAPWAISRSDVGEEPINQPTRSTRAPELIAASPLDEHWTGSSGTRAGRLAALDGTRLEGYGQAIYAEYLADATTDLQLANGAVTLSTSAMGGRFLGAHPDQASLHGTYTVSGHSVAMRFDEVPGTTVFRWRLVDDGATERLELIFTSTTAGSLYGAPAEVFFRMWSARPFWIWGCC